MTCPVLLKLIGFLPLTSVKGEFNARSVVGLGLVMAFKPISEGQIRLIISYSFRTPKGEKAYFLRD